MWDNKSNQILTLFNIPSVLMSVQLLAKIMFVLGVEVKSDVEQRWLIHVQGCKITEIKKLIDDCVS